MSKDGLPMLKSDELLLCDWARRVRKLFLDVMPYQVGSSLTDRDFRDVDVRVMLEEKQFDVLSANIDIERLNLCVSLWGQKVTGLPIDFQVQQRDQANNEYGHKIRSAIGMEL